MWGVRARPHTRRCALSHADRKVNTVLASLSAPSYIVITALSWVFLLHSYRISSYLRGQKT
jgi:hypothetical protein